MILKAGDRFGRYQIVRKLGEGGMAIVYEASSPFGVPVVLKVLNPEMIIEPDVVERFRREGRIQYTLRHPNIVRVTDIAEENGIPALVIDYLRGEDLEQAIARGRKFSLAEVITMAIKLLDALDTAHEHGFVHRDLKPSNIFLEAVDHGYEPRLMDFGIAKIQEAAALTRAQSFCGTPAYSSPEQVESTRDVDARADIFSFGVVVWEMLSGQQPWRQYAEDPYRVLLAVVREQLPDLPNTVPEVFRGIVSKAIRPDPSQRFATAREFRQALISASAADPELANTVVGAATGRSAASPAPARGQTAAPAAGKKHDIDVPELRQPMAPRPNPENELAAAARAARTALGHGGSTAAPAASQAGARPASAPANGGATVVPSQSAFPNTSSAPALTMTPGDGGQSTAVPPVGPTQTVSLPENAAYESQPKAPPAAFVRPVTMLPDGIGSPARSADSSVEDVDPIVAFNEGHDPEDPDVVAPVEIPPIEEKDSLLDRVIEAVRAYGLKVFTALVFIGLIFVGVDLLWDSSPLPDDFVVIEPTTFVMGSPVGEAGRRSDENQHRVTLSYRFAVQDHEVTRREYGELMAEVPSDFESCGEDCPVMNVAWADAAVYANSRSMNEGLDTCYRISNDNGLRTVSWPEGLRCEGYRLPTEAEWELAARAGVSESTWAGNVTATGRSPLDPVLGNIAVYGGNSAVTWNNAENCANWNTGAERCGPQTIRSRAANPNRLYDVIGNASEWVWDYYAALPSDPVSDPTGPTQGSSRVVRGCSYRDTAELCRVSAREGMAVVGRRTIGFRLVRTLH